MQTRPVLFARHFSLALTALAALAACSSMAPASFPNAKGTTPVGAPQPAPNSAHEREASQLEASAAGANPADKPALQLQAARAWLQAGRPADAARNVRAITGKLTAEQLSARRIIEADIDLANGQAQRAWQKISAIPEPAGTPIAPQYFSSRMRIALAAARPVEGVRAEMAAERLA